MERDVLIWVCKRREKWCESIGNFI